MTQAPKSSMAGPTTNHDEIRCWAKKNKAVPAEILPHVLDHEPTVLRMMLPEMAADHDNIRMISWEEFFAKFDLLGLTFVYDNNATGYNELLQMEGRSPYRSSRDQPIDPHN